MNMRALYQHANVGQITVAVAAVDPVRARPTKLETSALCTIVPNLSITQVDVDLRSHKVTLM